MGGSAFATGPDPLFTPRMPPPVYNRIRSHCADALNRLFHTVASPIDGPGKTDYGDVDMMVSRPVDATSGIDAVGPALGAKRVIVGGCCVTVAVPWPENLVGDDLNDSRPRFVQVDIRLYADDDRLRWMLFKHAHGDLGSILGTIVHSYGLTLTDEGLFIRVPDMEPSHRKTARVLVTNDADVALDLLSLSATRFWEGPFASGDEMYEFAASCPMFSVSKADDDDENSRASDRRRVRCRPCFRRWKKDYVSSCRREGRFLEQRTTRKRVTDEILTRFDDTRTEFQARRLVFLRDQQERHIRTEIIAPIASALAEKQDMSDAQRAVTYRACLAKGLGRVVLAGDESYGVVRPEDGFVDDDGLYALERVAAFVRVEAEAVGRAAMDRHYQRLGGIRAIKEQD
ncbi:hypothetical protein GQ602_004679 [Ophiocordyceps camponoti-floridani]|uniref:Uncharacterized protein n=1 Tax=Ophiocordyceps camponoti-floridani TaxID=2030778 RepID=A0A8H4VC88_9HYPO|nr:hypothetical protein GQ602_004679 [Ophiocordyceps camponoti-floridani]